MNEAPLERLQHRWWAIAGVLIALGVALRLEALRIGFLGDDWMQIAMMEGLYPGERHPLDLYMFVSNAPDEFARHRALGTLPWWTDPALHGGVFRPLGSALLWLDHAIAPMHPGVHHAHALAWWAAAMTAAAAVFRRALPPLAGLLALGLFAVDDGVTMNIGWLANRCTLVCAAFGFTAVWAQLRWREEGWSRGPTVAAVATTAAVAAGEYGIVTAAYAFAYEVFGRRSRGRDLVVALLPIGVPVAAYLVVHQALGYGTYGAEVYADPVHAPVGYLGWVARRIPMLTSELWWSLPAATGDAYARPFFGYLGAEHLDHLGWWRALGLIGDQPGEAALRAAHVRLATITMAVAAAVVAASWAALLPSERRTLRWLIPGALLGLLPVCVAPAHGRLLLLSELGACALLGAMGAATVRLFRDHATPRRPLIAVVGPLMLFVHGVADPVWSVGYMHDFRDIHDRIDAGLLDALDDPAVAWADRDAVVISARDQTTALHAELALSLRGLPAPRTWHVLSMSLRPHILRRTGPRTLELSVLDGAMLTDPPELFFRPSTASPRVGDVFEDAIMTARVLRTDPDGGVQAVSFTFVEDLDAPRWILLTNANGIRPFPMPRVGQTVFSPPTWVAE